MKVMVTGGHGFIGRHLVADLRCRPAIEVIAPTRKQLDVTNNLAVAKFIKKHKPEVIYHLAALISRDKKRIREIMDVNVNGTLNILNNANNSKIILMGSFEEPKYSLYGLSKDVATKCGLLYNSINNTNVTIIKPTIAYGPGQKGNMFIPAMMKANIKDELFQMSEGKQKRDFVYIDDLIEALIKVLDVECKGEIIEIGSGKAVKLIKLPQYLKNMVFDKEDSLKFKTNKTKIRKGEVYKIQANLKKAKNILNWKPKINLKEGLKRTLEWWCKQ